MHREPDRVCPVSPVVAALALLLACSSADAGPQSPTSGQIPTRDAPLVTVSTEQNPAARAAEAPGNATTGPLLVCEVFCSETLLRTAVARLSWIETSPPTGAPAAPTDPGVEPRAIEATVYHQGFEKGLYVRLPLDGGVDLQAAPAPGLAQQDSPLPRALQLRLGGVDRGTTAVNPAVAPRLPEDAQQPKDRQGLAVEVENLEPGMAYTWRMTDGGAVGASPEVTCVAPVCPVDFVREEEPR